MALAWTRTPALLIFVPVAQTLDAMDLDVFELLDVARREDSYSSVLVHALRASARLRDRFFAHAFADPPALHGHTVKLRHKLQGKRAIDIVVLALDAEDRPWCLFVESKIDAGEGPRQTSEYLVAARAEAGDPSRASGIFLTLGGERAGADGLPRLTHRELADWLESALVDFSYDPTLTFVVDAYCRRARAPRPVAMPGLALSDLLRHHRGLLPLLAGWSALGDAISMAAGDGWTAQAIRIGSAASTPALQFRRDSWRGPEIVGRRWDAANIDIHAEIAFVGKGTWPLRLHFETSPYRSKEDLAKIHNVAAFRQARKVFGAAFHARAKGIDSWKMTGYKLQVATWSPAIGDSPSVGEAVAAYGGSLARITHATEVAIAELRGILAAR